MGIGNWLKSVEIGGVKIKNNLFMAPLAGYTDVAFRNMVRRMGAGLTYTEMVSCKGLLYGNDKTEDLLKKGEEETPSAAQIFGADPEIMRKAAELPVLQKFDIIDVNMGCPVPKLFQNGEGSALLQNPVLAEKIVREVVKCGKPVTVKFRIGLTEGNCITADFARRMEDAGASALTVHGRVRSAYYAGEPDYNEIAKAVRAVQIPVIANGGIFSVKDGVKTFEETGAAGIMLARGAMFDPALFCDFLGKERPVFSEVVTRQIRELAAVFPDRVAAVNFRKQFAAYLRGVRDGKRAKEAVFAAESTEELIRIVQSLDWSEREKFAE